MGELLQISLSGVLLGSVYAALVLSLWLLWSAARVVNVAHGDLAMAGAYAAWWLSARHDWEPLAVLLVAAPAAALVGAAAHRMVFSRLLGRPLLASIAVTFGLSIALQAAARSAFTSMPQAARSTLGWAGVVAPAGVPAGRVVSGAVAAAAVIILVMSLRRTKTGKSVRAVAQNADAARLVGIEVNRVAGLTVATSFAIAVAAGVLITQFQQIQPAMGVPLTVKAFAIAAVSGLRSVRAVVAAGIGLGVIESALTAVSPLSSGNLAIIIGAGVLLAALAFRPAVSSLQAAVESRP